MAGSLYKPARSGLGRLSSLHGCAFAVYSACALTFAGMYSLNPSFFVLPDGTQEASAASLLGITAAQGRSRLGNPPSTCVPRRFCTVAPFRLVPRRMEQVPSRLSHVGLTGAITKMSGSGSFEARSTPRRRAARVRPFDSVEARSTMQTVWAGSNIFPLHSLPRRS